MEKSRELAIAILDTFENMLDEKNITIPDEEDAERDPDNSARLYGLTYYDLEDKIQAILEPELAPPVVPFVILHDFDKELEQSLNGYNNSECD